MNLFDYQKDVVLHGNVAYIDGERLKTGTKFYTPILPPAMEVLKKYEYKLPVPSVQSYNRMLRCVGELLGFKKPLTSHLANHISVYYLLKIRQLHQFSNK